MKKDNRMRINALNTRAVALIAAALALTPMMGVLTGCGGGSKSAAPASRAKGSVTFRVNFPKVSRVIPIAAKSVYVTMVRTQPGPLEGPPKTLVLTAPPANQPDNRVVSGTIDNLELGTYSVTAIASPNEDPTTDTGVAQASATVDKVIGAGDNGLIPMVMFATVKTLEITSDSSEDLTPTKTKQLTATAKDADGNTVIIGAGTIFWTSANPGVVRVDANGLATGVTPGTADITAKYKEPFTPDGEEGTGATGTVNLRVADVGLALTSWPKFHGDAQNTGQATVGASTSGNLIGAFNIAADPVIFSSPTVGQDGTIYVGSYDNKMYAINPSLQGTAPKWTFETGDDIDATPVVDKNNNVYFGSWDKKFYALRGDSGVQVWVFTEADGPIVRSATLSKNGFLYFGTAEGGTKFFAVDSLTGKKKWVFDAGDAVQTNAALSPDEQWVYFGTGSGKVYALNALTGAVKPGWETPFQAGGEIYNSSPAVDKSGNIYFGSLDHKVYALKPDKTSVSGAWPFDTGAKVYATPAISNRAGVPETVYIATFDDTTNINHNLIALDPITAAPQWAQPFVAAKGITSSPAIGADGVIYFGDYDGKLYAVYPNGTQKWEPVSTGISNSIDSSPAIGPDGAVYIATFGVQSEIPADNIKSALVGVR